MASSLHQNLLECYETVVIYNARMERSFSKIGRNANYMPIVIYLWWDPFLHSPNGCQWPEAPSTRRANQPILGQIPFPSCFVSILNSVKIETGSSNNAILCKYNKHTLTQTFDCVVYTELTVAIGGKLCMHSNTINFHLRPQSVCGCVRRVCESRCRGIEQFKWMSSLRITKKKYKQKQIEFRRFFFITQNDILYLNRVTI